MLCGLGLCGVHTEVLKAHIKAKVKLGINVSTVGQNKFHSDEIIAYRISSSPHTVSISFAPIFSFAACLILASLMRAVQ